MIYTKAKLKGGRGFYNAALMRVLPKRLQGQRFHEQSQAVPVPGVRKALKSHASAAQVRRAEAGEMRMLFVIASFIGALATLGLYIGFAEDLTATIAAFWILSQIIYWARKILQSWRRGV